MRVDRERSQHKIQEWVKPGSMSAAKAVSHAAHLLRDGIRKLNNWDAGNVFHYPWCLYLATLTCWAFQIAGQTREARDGQRGIGSGENANDEDADWDSKAEMNALVSAVTRSRLDELWKVAERYRSNDLPMIMTKHLSTIRWAVVQEGMIVLRSLANSAEHE